LTLPQHDRLMRVYKLKLVTTSMACEVSLRNRPLSPRQVFSDGDAMAASCAQVVETKDAAQMPLPASTPEGVPLGKLSRVEPIASSSAALVKKSVVSPTEIVANSLSQAANAAAAAAASAAGSVYTAAVPYAAPLANNISGFTISMASSLPIKAVAQQLQNAASAGHTTAIATVATVSAAIEATWSRERHRVGTARECTSPTAWFVADAADCSTRFFVIQGSDNLDHWRVNLTFDPVVFEDPDLGIKVHRGVYESAELLYDRFLPMVKEYLATSPPDSRVCFTGHSLGGSLSTMLMFMYIHRGVLPLHRAAPVYTFGAPAVFCEVNCVDFEYDASHGLLAQLGLPQDMVRNVVMHKDIVPRAFACNYALVADLLKRVGESYRSHELLSTQRQMLYNFVGQLMVLQPSEDHSFVWEGEGYHPMLPQGPGLFLLQRPNGEASACLLGCFVLFRYQFCALCLSARSLICCTDLKVAIYFFCLCRDGFRGRRLARGAPDGPTWHYAFHGQRDCLVPDEQSSSS
jgi:hypothetical protein